MLYVRPWEFLNQWRLKGLFQGRPLAEWLSSHTPLGGRDFAGWDPRRGRGAAREAVLRGRPHSRTRRTCVWNIQPCTGRLWGGGGEEEKRLAAVVSSGASVRIELWSRYNKQKKKKRGKLKGPPIEVISLVLSYCAANKNYFNQHVSTWKNY